MMPGVGALGPMGPGVAPAAPAVIGGGIALGPAGAPAQQAAAPIVDDNRLDMEELKQVILQLQGGEKKKKKKKDKKKKKKKEKYQDNDSDGSSSSSSSSGSEEDGSYPLPYKENAKKAKVTPVMASKLLALRFKKRADLLSFSQRFPGALAAYLMWQIRQKLGMAQAENLEQLAQTDCSSWASNSAMTGCTDVRDVKELQFLSRILVDLGQKKISSVADICAQRMREIKAAKSAGGSWEKASSLSLMPQCLANSVAMVDNAFVV
jgi:hypothetical protein